MERKRGVLGECVVRGAREDFFRKSDFLWVPKVEWVQTRPRAGRSISQAEP